jgi:RNA polymerase sigma-70 factor (ECF subfamily)
MSQSAELNSFLIEVEQKAYRMAMYAVKDSSEALDIVQDAMLMLAEKYAHKTRAEWRPLFYRILHNRITDTHRRNTRRWRLFARPVETSDAADADERQADPMASLEGPPSANPEMRSQLDATTQRLSELVDALPARQQQAFLLRAWEGLSVAATATAMRCSQGSVKTHYSRAVHSLRDALAEIW